MQGMVKLSARAKERHPNPSRLKSAFQYLVTWELSERWWSLPRLPSWAGAGVHHPRVNSSASAKLYSTGSL